MLDCDFVSNVCATLWKCIAFDWTWKLNEREKMSWWKYWWRAHLYPLYFHSTEDSNVRELKHYERSVEKSWRTSQYHRKNIYRSYLNEGSPFHFTFVKRFTAIHSFISFSLFHFENFSLSRIHFFRVCALSNFFVWFNFPLLTSPYNFFFFLTLSLSFRNCVWNFVVMLYIHQSQWYSFFPHSLLRIKFSVFLLVLFFYTRTLVVVQCLGGCVSLTSILFTRLVEFSFDQKTFVLCSPYKQKPKKKTILKSMILHLALVPRSLTFVNISMKRESKTFCFIRYAWTLTIFSSHLISLLFHSPI